MYLNRIVVLKTGDPRVEVKLPYKQYSLFDIFESQGGRGGGLADRAADSCLCDRSSIPLGKIRKINKKVAGVGPY